MQKQPSRRCSLWSRRNSARSRSLASLRVHGHPASPGYGRGPIVVVARAGPSRVATGDPAREAAALEAAIGAALDDLGRMAAGLSGEAADMLAFQSAMLADPAL